MARVRGKGGKWYKRGSNPLRSGRAYRGKRLMSDGYTAVKNKASTMIVKSPAVFADRLRVKLKYNEIINFTSVSYDGAYTFTGNGLYDCNITSTGTQPTGYDQWSAGYSQYRVYGSKIKIQASSAGTHPAVMCVLPCIDYANVTSGSINQIVRDPRSRTIYMSANSAESKSMMAYQSTKKAFGENDISDILYVGATGNVGTGSNPTNQWYWVLYGANVDAGGTLNTPVHVQITYYCEFFKRKDLATS